MRLGTALMSKILLVEDDPGLAGNLFNWLEFQGHKVELASTGEEGLCRIKESSFDFIVLDWELPGQVPGPEICRELRNRKINTPVMILTCRSSIDDKTFGFEAGADDYLTKPFHLQEFAMRMKALLRRPVVMLDPVLRFGDIALDPNSRTVTADGRKVTLQPLEFALLELLMRHPNVVFASEAIFERVWPSDTNSSLDVVRTHVKTLRRKLNPDNPAESPIKNVYGGGYKFETSN